MHYAGSSFNPRPRTGGDFFCSANISVHPQVSIHAPARGATLCFRFMPNRSDVSIHAPARGATRFHLGRQKLYRCFNPRPRTGGD